MKRISVSKRLTYIICMALTLATVLFAAGCGNGADKKAEGDLTEDAAAEEGSQAQGAGAIGEGNTVFPFTVVDKDGNETKFEVHTDKEIVGEA